MRRVSAGAIATLLLAAPAHAEGLAAIVEDVSRDGLGVAAMDMVEAGRVIELGPGDTLVLGYLGNCLRETITGSTVTVGVNESKLAGGSVLRELVDCGGGQLADDDAARQASAVTVVRGPEDGVALVRSTTPLLMFAAPPASVELVRTDRPAEPVRLTPSGATVDLAASRTYLWPGGTYEVRTGAGDAASFRVDAGAQAGGPLLTRLLRF